jgi:hypothetical protein
VNRTITLRLGTLLALAGAVSGLFSGYLIRRDVQTVNQAEVRQQLVTIQMDLASLKNEVAFARAYLGSIKEWAIRVSAKNGWPEPKAPGQFLPSRDSVHQSDSIIWGSTYADDEGAEAPERN